MRLVSQDFYVLDNHTVTENITDKLIGYADDYKQSRVTTLLQLLELTALKNSKAKYLSSGQKQRVAIARALADMPKILLLDEPFNNLDQLLTAKLFAFIAREVKKHKTAVILVTHTAEEALKYADEIAIMDNGRIVQKGPALDVYYRPANLKLAGLMGPYNILSSDDFDVKSPIKKKTKLLLRPDAFQLCSANTAHLQLECISSVFNGKCFENLLSSTTEKTISVYTPKALTLGKSYNFKIH